jgi:predicted DNA-binding transcriptional regulator AlpA
MDESFVVMRVAVPAGSVLSGELVANGERLLTAVEVARLLGIKPQTWWSYVQRGRAPRADDGSGREHLWRLATVREYQQGRRRRAFRLPK